MPEVLVEEARRFMTEALRSVGTPESEAKAHTDLLVHADVCGHFSHGMNRLEFYLNDVLFKTTDPYAKPVILKESASAAWVDGRDGLGATVGNFCMDLAIKKAKESGVGWVSAKGSNHFGMAGWWAKKAEAEGLIGLAFTNSSPIMVPTRAKHGALGTNPIAMAAPSTNGDSLLVDMATTAVALGKIEVQIHKGEPIPDGWALDSDGKPTNDAKTAMKAGKLLPLGGSESTSGYKGYGLSAMVEVFCTMLSDATPTHKVRMWTQDENQAPPNLGQCFVALDPGCFAPGFAERMAASLQHWRELEPKDPALPVLAPGDKERMNAEQTKSRGTIVYSQGQMDACAALARTFKIKPLDVASETSLKQFIDFMQLDKIMSMVFSKENAEKPTETPLSSKAFAKIIREAKVGTAY